MDLVDRRRRLGLRVATLIAGHVAMLALMFALLNAYEPEPNEFRLDTPSKLGSFAALTLAPVVIGFAARRFVAAAIVGLLQALSPLLLLGTMRDTDSDLNFAVLLWWFPLPAAAALIILVERFFGAPRRAPRGTLADR